LVVHKVLNLAVPRSNRGK